jgi:CHAT domain-containing protein
VPEGQGLDQPRFDARRHLAGCEACQKLVAMHERLSNSLRELQQAEPAGGSDECPSKNSIYELVAGLVEGKEAELLLNHAAECDHCGPLLREGAEILGPADAEEGEARIKALQTSSAEWQAKVARKLASVGVPPEYRPETAEPVKRYRWFPTVPAWGYVGAGVVVVGLAIVATIAWHSRPAYTNSLLAEAYAEHRTLEVRIPGAKYAPMRVERGSGISSLEKPSSLLKAEALIAENLRRAPNDSAWLQAKARADLLDGNYQSAIKSLQLALETQSGSPSLLADMGSAYYVRAEATGRPGDYGSAIQSLSEALAKSPNDPVILFNRALACEQMLLYDQAIKDWEQYLRVEPTGEWAESVRHKLERVRQEKKERDSRSAEPLLSPTEISEAIKVNRDSTIKTLDRRAEQYLGVAVQSWIPQVYSGNGSPVTSGVTRRALEILAEILRDRHDDSWLATFLQNRPASKLAQGVQFLGASEEALRAGRYYQSTKLAEKSASAFRESGNEPGVLQASFAVMLAQSLALKFGDCAGTAARTLPLLSARRYAWLHAQVLLQKGECLEGSAETDQALKAILLGGDIAREAHYPGLQLRAAAFEAARRNDIAGADRALRSVIGGLRIFWTSDLPNGTAETLYTVLSDIALSKNWNFIDMFAEAEILADFPPKDDVDLAVQEQVLAGAQERAGEYEAAEQTLERIVRQMAMLPEDPAVNIRKAEISLENAKIQLQLGRTDDAEATLAGVGGQFEKLDPGLFQAEYFRVYAETLLTLGRENRARTLLERALSISEKSLAGLHLEADKLAWSRARGSIYRDLLEIKLKSESPAAALAWWEWYRGASLRSSAAWNGSLVAAYDRSAIPQPLSPEMLPDGTALISYAVLRDSVLGFVMRNKTVTVRTLRSSGDPKLQELHFLHLCADPSLGLDAFRNASRKLYNALFAVLEPDVRGARALRIETDGILDRIPFDLLQDGAGRYLADRFEITYSSGVAYANRAKLGGISAASAAVIVVAPQQQESSQAALPGAAEEGSDVARYFRNASILSGSQVTREAVLSKLREAQEFHFVGHAVAGADRVGLLLGPETLLDARDLAAAQPRGLRLAVLSACETANGEEGSFADINSVARTLVASGVPQIVASRWNVDSVVTRDLMKEFYSRLMIGKTPTDALRDAVRRVRSLPGYEHPYYWGAFAVFGSS